MTWLLTLLGLGRKALSGAWMLIARYPWPAACIGLAVVSLWLWYDRGEVKADLVAEKQARAKDQETWNRKYEAAKQATAKAEQDAREVASDAQETHDKLAAENSGLERYIADHRVPAQQCPGRAASATEDHGAAVPPEAAASPVVAISEPDIRACDGAYVYARSAYEWGQGLIARGLAVEGK